MEKDKESPAAPVVIRRNQNPPLTRRQQILYTTAIWCSNVTFGCAFNFYSPALKDFKTKFDVETDEISRVFTISLVCYCLGALTSGIYYNYINRQFVIILLFAGMATSMFVSPHCPNITIFFIIGGLLGYCVGAYDSAQIVWMMEIWQSKAGPFVQAQHFCYALGSSIPPLILAPFLSNNDDDDTDSNTPTTLLPSTTFPLETEESRVYIPFTIAGALNTFACLYHLFLFIFYRYRTPPTEEELEYDNNNNSQADSKSIDEMSKVSSQDALDSSTPEEPFSFKNVNWPRIRLIAITLMFVGGYNGMEMSNMQFVPTFGQKSELELSESESANVLTGLTSAFAVGRFIGIFVILKVPPVLLLCFNLSCILVANVIMLIWAKSNLIMLWTGCILIGAGFSTIYASFSLFIERNLVFTNIVGALMVVSSSGIASIYPVIIGASIDENVVVITYTTFFSVAVCSTALLLAVKVTSKQEGRLM